MSRKTDRQNLNQFWQLFVHEGLHEKGITAEDIREPGLPYPAVAGLHYDDACKLLKIFLSENGWKRLNNRFRQFKSRKVSNKTTISLREDTLARLREIGREIGLDDYDMLFEYLLDPEEKLEPAKEAISSMASALTVDESTSLMLKKLSLRAATRRTILAAIEHAYVEGWRKGKAHKGRSVQSVITDDAEGYVNSLALHW